MSRANIWRRALRRALPGLVMLALGLAAFMMTSAPAHAAARQVAGNCPSVAACTQRQDCSDPEQITLACLNIIPDARPLPENKPEDTIQNPIASGSTLFFLTSPADTIGQATVVRLWSIMLIVVDVCGALMLILNGLYIIVGGTVFRYARAVETIPGMLFALIAAHISLIFIGVFLGFNNGAVYDLYQWVGNNITISMKSGVQVPAQDSPSPPNNVNGINCSTGESEAASCQNQPPAQNSPTQNNGPINCSTGGSEAASCQGPSMEDAFQTLQITPQNLDFTNMMQNIHTLFDMLSVVVKIMSLMLLAQVLIRLFFIDVYIVLAPLGIACWALPGKVGQPVTRMWFQGFISTVLVQFVQVVALIVVEALLLPLFNYFYPHIVNISQPVMQANTLVMILNIALLWFVFRIPSLFEAAPMRSLIEAGQSMSAAVGMSMAVQIGQMQMVFSGAAGGVGLLAGLLG